MPKFALLKDGVNETLIKATQTKIASYLSRLFDEQELVIVDGLYAFTFGTVQIEVQVISWHSEDVLVKVFSYLAQDVTLTKEMSEELLRLNSTLSFGSFGITFDNSVVFSYSLAGANIDFNEFSAAIQTVATIADEYDEKIQSQKV
ncbi:YbjN domain-containing protein [Rhodocytophaga aerolata]|uniref:YbjN domain-containing protein n=1 Tax=Rhodocytophaga aerolata TaxID=455078 RepID=A0ABT8RFI1_9BACT|nr:YbjN domain-containing protein [Rhodocytophaga aerolata]MDO1450084.1 YbjN domain-containing protein [Rhodocytophaga aerolata]